jgi:hypothetical protein
MDGNELHLRLQNHSYRWGGVALVCLVLSYLVEQFLVHEVQVVGHLLRDIGIAVLVGIYLTWTLERLSAARVESEVQQYIRSVGDSVVRAVYGRALPDRLFHTVKQSVFDVSFIRLSYHGDLALHNFTQRYVEAAPASVKHLLEDFETKARELSGNLVVLRSSLYYEVKNITDRAAKYEVFWEVPKPFGGQYPGLCGITSVLVDRQQQVAEAYTENARQDIAPTVLRYSQLVEVPPSESTRIELEAYAIRSADDWEPWVTVIPCNGMFISVSDMDGDKDIVLTLQAPGLEGTVPFAVKDARTNKASLSIKQYLLPYQGIMITWAPSRPGEVRLDAAELTKPAHLALTGDGKVSERLLDA